MANRVGGGFLKDFIYMFFADDSRLTKVKCVFKFGYGTDCEDSKPCSSNKGRARIDTIINASKVYMDDLDVGLLKQIADNSWE